MTRPLRRSRPSASLALAALLLATGLPVAAQECEPPPPPPVAPPPTS